MKILIDRNIAINSITHKTVLVPQTINWGDIQQTIEVAQRKHFPPRKDEKFRLEQLPYLATLCLLAKQGKIDFLSAFELLMENMRQKGRDEGYLGLNLLRGVKIGSVKSPIDRNIIINSFAENFGTTESEQMAFFSSITHHRFLKIRQLVGDKHMDDAFHLWTAEENDLNGFLTMDHKFWKVVNQKKRKIEPKAAVFTPLELCKILKAQPTDIEKLAAENPPFS